MDGVLTRLYATHANILTSQRSTVGHPDYFSAMRMLSYRMIIPGNYHTLSFGTLLSPGMFSAQGNLTSELLRYL